jgi:hypothetical protein
MAFFYSVFCLALAVGLCWYGRRTERCQENGARMSGWWPSPQHPEHEAMVEWVWGRV